MSEKIEIGAPKTNERKSDWVGQSVPRKEENRLLRGRGKFTDDIKAGDMLYLRFVRSPYAHARITGLDIAAAAALPGVHAILTGEEIRSQTTPFIEIGDCSIDTPLALRRPISSLWTKFATRLGFFAAFAAASN